MDLKTRMTELARTEPSSTPVVSVYLNTHWRDEHQRDRVRVFLKNALAEARAARVAGLSEADLHWVETEGDALLSQTSMTEARGVALFACEAAGLREILPSGAPFENLFRVAEAPVVRPLAELVELAPPALVVFVDAESARLMLVSPDGAVEEEVLRADVPGHHRRGGWAQMAQSRYQRHIQDHRARHFAAVAEAVVGLVDEHQVRRIVLAGDPPNVPVFREQLPRRIADLVVGTVAGAHHEATAVMVGRAAEYVSHAQAQLEAAAVDAALTTAAKRGRATAGLDATLEAVNRGAVHRLYLLKGWSTPGRRCTGCGRLQAGFTWVCPTCGREATTVDLAEAITARVIAAGGSMGTIESHQPLAAAGGVAAELRFPL
jgi:peptide subunit release factor 1 (eRF1)